CSTRQVSKRLIQHKQIAAASLQSSTISTTQAATSSTITGSTRLSLPSQQKITRQSKMNITLTSSQFDSNIPMDGYTIIQNQMLH
ncbi:unnamed protein product, partial [Rotaria sp. Silwood2]